MSPRKLSHEEIKDILSIIPLRKGFINECTNDIRKRICNGLKKQLKGILVYPEIIPDLKENILKEYHRSVIVAGEAVGVILAQSIGEKQTQSNLSSFHKAGSADNKVGKTVSKFGEILNASSKVHASCFIRFLEGKESVPRLREVIGSSLTEITLEKICLSVSFQNAEENQELKPRFWDETFTQLYGEIPFDKTDRIVCVLNMNKLFEFHLTLEDIAKSIQTKFPDLFCIFSPDCFGMIDIYIDTNDINLENHKSILYITEENKREVYLEEVAIPTLKKTHLIGVNGVKQVFFLKDKNNDWIVETDGGDFVQLMLHPKVDFTTIISNNIWDIYNILGIEAVRQFMINELNGLMEGINTCHTTLLVDKMTYTGTITSISRYSMRIDESGPFAKASFEETVDNLLKAGSFCEVEKARGISASIICGKKGRVGTGIVDLMMMIPEEDK